MSKAAKAMPFPAKKGGKKVMPKAPAKKAK